MTFFVEFWDLAIRQRLKGEKGTHNLLAKCLLKSRHASLHVSLLLLSV